MAAKKKTLEAFSSRFFSFETAEEYFVFHSSAGSQKLEERFLVVGVVAVGDWETERLSSIVKSVFEGLSSLGRLPWVLGWGHDASFLESAHTRALESAKGNPVAENSRPIVFKVYIRNFEVSDWNSLRLSLVLQVPPFRSVSGSKVSSLINKKSRNISCRRPSYTDDEDFTAGTIVTYAVRLWFAKVSSHFAHRGRNEEGVSESWAFVLLGGDGCRKGQK